MADDRKPGGKKSKKSDTRAPESPDNEPETVASRVSNLPLVSSACEAVSSAYNATKESVPLLKGVMSVAESGVRTLGAAASTGAQPLLNMMEPQLAAANECALRGLDRVEENVPVLHQPAEQVVADTVERVCQTVAGAMEAVRGGVERTLEAVSSGINTVMGKEEEEADTELDLTKRQYGEWVNPALPVSESDLVAVAETNTSGLVTSPGSYFVRLSRLDDDLQKRALEISLARAKHYMERATTTISQISGILKLAENLKADPSQSNTVSKQLQDHWLIWAALRKKRFGKEPDPTKDLENVESKSLVIMCDLSEELLTECSHIVSSSDGLHGLITEHLAILKSSINELYRNLDVSTRITPDIITDTYSSLDQVKNSVVQIIKDLTEKSQGTWLVGPFRAQFPKRAGDVSRPGPSKQTSTC